MHFEVLEGGAPRHAAGNVVETHGMDRDGIPEVPGTWHLLDEAVELSGVSEATLRPKAQKGKIWARHALHPNPNGKGPRERVEIFLGEDKQPVVRTTVNSESKVIRSQGKARRPAIDMKAPEDWIDAGTGFGSSIGFMVEREIQSLQARLDEQTARIAELNDHIATLKRTQHAV